MSKRDTIFHERRDTKLPAGIMVDPESFTYELILQALCYKFQINEDMLKSLSRERAIVYPRQIALYLLSVNKDIGMVDAAARLNRNHSTLVSSRNRIEDYIDLYPEMSMDLIEIIEYVQWLSQLEKEIIMTEIPSSKIRYFYFLLDQLGIRWMKNDLVMDASNGRTQSTRELTISEMDELVSHLELKVNAARNDASPKMRNIQRMDRMRKRIFSICYSIGWVTIDHEKNTHIVDEDRLNAWLMKYGYLHKPLMEYTYMELPALITQFERLLKTTLSNLK